MLCVFICWVCSLGEARVSLVWPPLSPPSYHCSWPPPHHGASGHWNYSPPRAACIAARPITLHALARAEPYSWLTLTSRLYIYIRGFTKFWITAACGLKYHWYLRTLSLKQKARTKIEVFLSLPCWLSQLNCKHFKSPIISSILFALKTKWTSILSKAGYM